MKYILTTVLMLIFLSVPAEAKKATASAPAASGERPAESDLFSAPEILSGQEKSAAPESTDQKARPQETEIFQTNQQEPTLSQTAGPEDPLEIGGMMYLRMLSQAREGQALRDVTFSTPMLVDMYLDARPNDRVHAEVVGRINYDPTGNSNKRFELKQEPNPDGTSTIKLSSIASTDPQFILSQLWIRFDIARTVFVTAGKQNIKWGSAHFFNPTDFLQPVRNPLEPFDVRTGSTMLKFHLPWEKYGWNFYAVALLEKVNPYQSLQEQAKALSDQSDASSNLLSTFNLGNLGGAVRAEFVFSTFEIGADFVARYGQRPKYGFDISAGLDSLLHIPVDIYAEVALRHGSDTTRFRQTGEPYNPINITPQVSCGLSWSTLYNDQDQIIVGAEYFYNSLGYDDSKLYPWLVVNGAFQPFYAGRHYAALLVSLPNPGSWDNTTFTLSSIGNLSDSSFVVRLDYSVLVLTYLRIEAYVAGYLGTPGGEFRLTYRTEKATYNLPDSNTSIIVPAFNVTTPIIDVGLSLRIDI